MSPRHRHLAAAILMIAGFFNIGSACVATAENPSSIENVAYRIDALNNTCVTGTLTEDATIARLISNPAIGNTNYGTTVTLISGQQQTGTQNRALINVLPSGLVPNGATIISAVLSLNKTNGAGTGSSTAAYANASWAEGTVTWNSFGINTGATIGSVSASQPNNAYTTLDFAAAAQNWVNGTMPNYGLVFSPQNALIGFSSAEAPVLVRPKVDVCFATCSDGFQNAAETDIDCGGGTCAPCNADEMCAVDSDCTSPLLCKNGVCSVPTCDDQGLACGNDQIPNSCTGCAVQGACAGAYNTCLNSTACIDDYVGCRILCSDQECDNLCSAQFPQGAAEYNAVVVCINVEQCSQSCSGSQQSAKSTAGSGVLYQYIIPQ